MENFTRENVKKMARLLHLVEIHGTLGYHALGVRQKHLFRIMESAGLVKIRRPYNYPIGQHFIVYRK